MLHEQKYLNIISFNELQPYFNYTGPFIFVQQTKRLYCILTLYAPTPQNGYTHNGYIPSPILDEEKKLTYIFMFPLLCGASKGFMKTLKAFIKPFEAQQRSVKIKIQVYFQYNFLKCKGREGLTKFSDTEFSLHCFASGINDTGSWYMAIHRLDIPIIPWEYILLPYLSQNFITHNIYWK